MHKIFLPAGLVLTLLSGCQSPPPAAAPPVQANLSVRYLAAEQELRGQASLLRGDSLASAAPLSPPGGVSFLGSAMEERRLPGNVIRYTSIRQGPLPDPLRFSFRLSPADELREIELTLTPIDTLAVTRASRAEGLTFIFSGGLQAEEELLLLFTDADRQARTILLPGPITRPAYTVPAAALSEFTAGPYQLYLVKKSNTTRELPDGIIVHQSLEYYSEEVSLIME
jgi:hypothetical protein